MVLDLAQFRQRKLESEVARLPDDRSSWRQDQKLSDALTSLSVPPKENRTKFDVTADLDSITARLRGSGPALEEIHPDLLRALRRGPASRAAEHQAKSSEIQKPDDFKESMRNKLKLVP